ncbi:MAG TPA: hypothetical protein VN376_01050 [Longilinea sp.]|nr:hypothetical protein [Longilinea sp.]
MIPFILLPLLFFLPGLAIILWITPRKCGLFSLLIESAGLSLVVMALVAQVGFWLDLHFSISIVWLLLAAGVVSTATAVRVRKPEIGIHKEDWIGLGLLAVVTAWRFYQIDGMALPAWVDSVHHTLIVQSILAAGGLPQDLTPILPVPFFYHYVFHVFSAVFSALGHIQPYQAVLWVGQAVNALAVLGVYRLSLVLWGDYRKAGLAVLLAGFVLEMPAFYLAWGRYTLLTGLALLPLALASAWEVRVKNDPLQWLKLALFTSGVFLSHYLAGIILILAVFLLLLFDYLERKKASGWKFAWNILLGSCAGVLLALPWLWRAWSFTRRYAQITTDQFSMDSWDAWINLLGPWRNGLTLIIGLAGLVWVIGKPGKRWLAVWSLGLLFLSLPLGLRWGPFRPDHFSILLWLPAALLAAYAAVDGADWLARKFINPLPWVTLAACSVGLIVWGQVEMSHLVDDRMILGGSADIRAAEWVQQNTPEESRFLINTTLWQTASYRGVDGGYWLPVLAGRQTVLPPAMYGYGSAEYIHQINDWAERANRLTTCDDNFWGLVDQAALDYVYISDGHGSLQVEALRDCPGLTEEYNQDGIHILSIQP